jgi:phosphonate transport system substrate-binding protein
MTTFLPITYKEHWATVRQVDQAMGIEYSCN